MNAVLARNATDLALSTPKDVDIGGLVKVLATRKIDEHGRSVFSNQRGKQSLFASVCSWLKSLRGIGKEGHLPEAVAQSVKTECDTFFRTQVDSILAEYDRVVITRGGLRANVGKKGIRTEAIASVRAARDCKSNDESALACLLTMTQKENQVNALLDKPDYDRERVTLLQKQIDALRTERIKLQSRAEDIAVRQGVAESPEPVTHEVRPA